ncbi:MAG: preprotein translocase subunit SecY [Flavobacteriales bacterium]|nr:preprotein translocase subunit SecY [Flavobacteriales bacterium]
MKGFFKKLVEIFKHEELKKKILLTMGLILIYRIGCYIVIPGVDSVAVQDYFNTLSGSGGGFSITDILSLFTGGAFTSASIFALGIMPYISASIIMQLLGIAVPSIQKMQNEGESGRKKINQWTRTLTIAICLVQSPGYILTSIPENARPDFALWMPAAVIILTCSTLFVMWLGERITDKGIGNGISLLIMIGIIARFPQSIVQEAAHPENSFFFILIEVAAFFVVIMASVALVRAIRQVTVQRAKMNLGGHLPQGEGKRDYIPLRVNSAGVMPIIFAQAIMFVPLYLRTSETFKESTVLAALSDFSGFWYNLIFFLMIVIFTYFYTAITVNPNNIADDLKRQGTFIPGVKPGRPTAEFLDVILSRITLPGSVFLGLIAILPAVVLAIGLTKTQDFSYFFGGTSLLIMVGVVLDTLQQIDSYLLSRHYDGLMKSGKLSGRGTSVSGIAG